MNGTIMRKTVQTLGLSGLAWLLLTAPIGAVGPGSVAPPQEPSVEDALLPVGEGGERSSSAPSTPDAGGKWSRLQKKMTAKFRKRDLVEENLPVMAEIRHLKWETVSDWTGKPEARRVSLQDMFAQTIVHSVQLRQVTAQAADAEEQLRELKVPNLLNLLNPLDAAAVKKASEYNVQASKAQLLAARQAVLLESARAYADLVEAFLNKYLAYQAIEQGRNQLRADLQRFVAGETNRFDVTLTQMALIDRYGKYLAANNAYQAASLAASGRMGLPAGVGLVPEGVLLHDQEASVSLLQLLPPDLSLEQVLTAARQRPEIQVLQLRSQALEQLAKAPFASERHKKEAEHRQMVLELEKTMQHGVIRAEKSFNDYRLAVKNLDLAVQRYALANQFMRQLDVSHEAGFSSLKDVLDGQVEWARAKTGLISAQVRYNLSQIQLVYEMGLLDEEIGGNTLAVPSNIL